MTIDQNQIRAATLERVVDKTTVFMTAYRDLIRELDFVDKADLTFEPGDFGFDGLQHMDVDTVNNFGASLVALQTAMDANSHLHLKRFLSVSRE